MLVAGRGVPRMQRAAAAAAAAGGGGVSMSAAFVTPSGGWPPSSSSSVAAAAAAPSSSAFLHPPPPASSSPSPAAAAVVTPLAPSSASVYPSSSSSSSSSSRVSLLRWSEITRALRPSLQRSVVFSASQLGSYDLVKQWLKRRDPDLDPHWAILLSAWSAGVVSTAVVTPLDVAKTRLMVSDFRGTWDCLRCVVRYEGARHAWSGAVATWLRLGPYTMVQMVVWETLYGALSSSSSSSSLRQ